MAILRLGFVCHLLAAGLGSSASAIELGPAESAGPPVSAGAGPVVLGGLSSVATSDLALSAAPILAAPALSLSAPAFAAAPVAVAAPAAVSAAASACAASVAAAAAAQSASTPISVDAAEPSASARPNSTRAVPNETPHADMHALSAESRHPVAERLFDGVGSRAGFDAAVPSTALGMPAAEPTLAAASAHAAAAKPVPAPSRARRFAWPALVATVWTSWTALMTTGRHWGLFAHEWFMSATMALGSFVAGASSEGSGSISFPVMTLLFHIAPPVARDFSLMIQSVGMTTAALTIFAMRIPIERRAILWGALGGFIGMALGATFVAPLFVPAFAKMFFTSLWASFALAHWISSRRADRPVSEGIRSFGPRDAVVLALFGVVGGMVSSIVGTGLCMVIFTLLTLGYGVSEKIATPTSVILMASNALFGFFWKTAALGGMAAAAWNYWWVSVPIVVIGAPLGARFIAGRSRKFVSGLLYTAVAAQLLVALLIVPQTPPLLAVSAATFIGGQLIFRAMARRGAARAKAEGSAAV
jgi:uncharacterized membrane protein YfcA